MGKRGPKPQDWTAPMAVRFNPEVGARVDAALSAARDRLPWSDSYKSKSAFVRHLVELGCRQIEKRIENVNEDQMELFK